MSDHLSQLEAPAEAIAPLVSRKRERSNGHFLEPGKPSSGFRAVYFSIFSVVLLLSVIRIVQDPAYNWDLIAYTACVHSITDNDPALIHQKTFADLEKRLPEKAYKNLTTNWKYQIAMVSDPIGFYQQLPFYRVKPLYIGILYGFAKLGLDVTTATIALSAASYVFLSLICYVWINKYISGLGGLIVSVLTALTPPLLQTATLSTPDLLSGALLLAGVYLLLEQRSTRFAAIAFVLGLVARPDNVLFLLILLTGLRFIRTSWFSLTNWQYIFSCATVVGLYLLTNVLAEGYGWKTLFEHTFVGQINRPAEYVPVITVGEYVKALLRACDSTRRSYLLVYLVPAFVCLWLHLQTKVRMGDDLHVCLLYVIIAGVVARLLVHPAVFDRFLVAYFLGIELICIVLLSRVIAHLARIPPVAKHV